MSQEQCLNLSLPQYETLQLDGPWWLICTSLSLDLHLNLIETTKDDNIHLCYILTHSVILMVLQKWCFWNTASGGTAYTNHSTVLRQLEKNTCRSGAYSKPVQPQKQREANASPGKTTASSHEYSTPLAWTGWKYKVSWFLGHQPRCVPLCIQNIRVTVHFIYFILLLFNMQQYTVTLYVLHRHFPHQVG